MTGKPVLAEPRHACDGAALSNGDRFKGRIVVVERGGCMFVGESENFLSYLLRRS